VILEELELRNFRSHKNTRLRFDEGTTVIVGDNGSGKTSILEAVGYALFRETPSRVRIEELVRRGGEKEGMQVSLRFTIDGRRYRVTRTYSEGRSGAVLYDGEGRIISAGEKNRQTTKEIERRIRMDSKLFTNAIYIRQGQIDALLTADARERKELIGKLIGTQELEKAFVNMREIIGEYDMLIQRYIDIPSAIKDTESRIKQERLAIQKLREGIEDIEERLRKVAAQKTAREREAELLERVLEMDRELRLKERELEMNQRRIREIEENERTIKSTKDSKVRYEKINGEIMALEKKISALREVQKSIAQLRQDIMEKEKKIAQLRAVRERGLKEGGDLLEVEITDTETLGEALSREKQRLEKELEELDPLIKRLERKIGALRGKNKDIAEALRELKGAEERCPVCMRPLTREHRDRVLRKYQEAMRRNQLEIENISKEIERLENKRRSGIERLRKVSAVNVEIIRNACTELEKTKAEIRVLGEEIKEKEEKIREINDLEKTIEELRREQASLKPDYERYIAAVGFLRKNAPEKDNIKDSIRILGERIDELRARIRDSGVTPDMKKLERVRAEVKSLYDAVTALSNEKSARDAEAREKERVVEELTQRLRELEEKRREGEKLGEFLDLLRKIRSLFHKDNLQKKLRARARPLIERHAREEFQKFHLPYSDISLTEDFEITLYGPEGDVRMDMLSGGERIAAALALRIGIAKALAGQAMELLMLDEPTIHLDATRRRELVEIIKSLATIPQTIVVTHDKEFEGAADRLLVVEKMDGVSIVRDG
jgi:exonuclease SbcC